MLYNSLGMKTLKLDHHLAQAVIAGEKTSAWRLFDDKDIRVGDDIELVDKVNPNDESSWIVIGQGVVTQVTEKLFGAVNKDEFKGYEKFDSKDQMYQTYSDYYGKRVDGNTIVKLIEFSFVPSNKRQSYNPVRRISKAKLYADGGSRGNPGPSAFGYAIMDLEDNVVKKYGEYLGVTTNNQAEYQSLKHGLEEAIKMGIQEVDVYMDSMLVVNQMKGIFKVKNRDLWPIHEAIKQLATKFKRITYAHVPRERNKIADSAVNEALDAQADK